MFVRFGTGLAIAWLVALGLAPAGAADLSRGDSKPARSGASDLAFGRAGSERRLARPAEYSSRPRAITSGSYCRSPGCNHAIPARADQALLLSRGLPEATAGTSSKSDFLLPPSSASRFRVTQLPGAGHHFGEYWGSRFCRELNSRLAGASRADIPAKGSSDRDRRSEPAPGPACRPRPRFDCSRSRPPRPPRCDRGGRGGRLHQSATGR